MAFATMFGLTIVAEIALQQRLLRRLADCGVAEYYTLPCARREPTSSAEMERNLTHVRIDAVADEQVADKVAEVIQSEGYPVDLFISEVKVRARREKGASTAAAAGESRMVSWARDLLSM